MKVLVLVGSGIADRPLEELDGRTPLEVADIPGLNRLASNGHAGGWRSAPSEQIPGTGAALCTFLGYKNRVSGGALEAAGVGIDLREDEVAFQANLVCLKPGATNVVMFDPIGCGVSDEEGAEIVGYLEEHLAADPGEEIRLHSIGGHRAILTYRKDGFRVPEEALAGFSPPHHIAGETIEGHLPPVEVARRFVHIVNDSQMILSLHPGLRKKLETTMFAANSLWLWEGGQKASLPPFSQTVGRGDVTLIAWNPVALGLGRLGGAEVIRPTGTGSARRNAMVESARQALKTSEFILLFADDAAGASERGDAAGKVAAIEALDAEILAPLLGDPGDEGPCRILFLSDHIASTETRRGVLGPVPYAMADWEAGRLSPPAGRSGLAGLWGRIFGRNQSAATPSAFSERLCETSRPLSGKALLDRLLAA